MSEVIKPCPFCGHMPEYVGNGGGMSYLCVNDDCATSGSWSFHDGADGSAEHRAREMWNGRVGDTTAALRLKAANELLLWVIKRVGNMTTTREWHEWLSEADKFISDNGGYDGKGVTP